MWGKPNNNAIEERFKEFEDMIAQLDKKTSPEPVVGALAELKDRVLALELEFKRLKDLLLRETPAGNVVLSKYGRNLKRVIGRPI